MTLSIAHPDAPDGTFSAAGTSAWLAKHPLTGTASRLVAIDGSGNGTDDPSGLSPTLTGLTLSGLSANRFVTTGAGGLIQAASAITTGQVILADSNGLPTGDTGLIYTSSQLRGNFNGIYVSGSAAASTELRVKVGTGAGAAGAVQVTTGGTFSWTGGTDVTAVANSTIASSTANSVVFGGNNAGAGNSATRTEINKAVTGIADAAATAALTVTIPNGAHSASIRVRLTGSLGAGGAIGANESTQDAEYMVNVTRTAGVNAVATIGAVVGQAGFASVAGAANATVTGGISVISGAVGATNTFTINVTITKSGGSSANHTCLAFAELLNANSSGVTIA